MRSMLAVAALLALGLTQPVQAQDTAGANPSPQGRWITESGNLEVEIAPCGHTDAALCGKVVRVLANRSMSGSGADMAAADTRPALGMTLLTDLRLNDRAASEYRGEIYNRENAKTYRVHVTPAEPDQLLVRAYVGIPLFGKTQVWRRPAADSGSPQ